MSAVSYMYAQLYKVAFDILFNENITDYEIAELLPNNHLLFGTIDLLFYQKTDITVNDTEHICELLSFNVDLTEQHNTILDTEIELLKNRFNTIVVDKTINGRKVRISSLKQIKEFYEEHMDNIIRKLLGQNFDITKMDIYDVIFNHGGNRNIMNFIDFIEFYKLDNGIIIIDYIKQLNTNIPWRNNCLELYDMYKRLYDDIDKLLDKNSGIIENYENKMFTHIPDPIDKYFKPFEEELEKIKDPKFSRFIDLTTFKPSNIEQKLKYKLNNTSMFLNNKDYSQFQIEKEDYENKKKKYNDLYEEYKEKEKSKSPKFPEKPIILLGNGTPYIYGHQEPVNIKDDLVKEFNKEYKRVEKTIKQYNEIKNLSYTELVKYGTDKSPSSLIKIKIKIKIKMKENELFKMSREEITNNILNDYSDLEDKCNERIDILTKNEFNDDNYPLAALQLMIRLKMNKKAECIYAPALYNYLIDCVNSKIPFVNPKTKIY
jgi:hypothetical protein